MSALVIWSGGVESTSMLKHLLESTMTRVVAHHIVLRTSERRAEAESRAVNLLGAELTSRFRPFEYSRSDVNLVNGDGLVPDFSLWIPIAIAAMRVHGCTHIVRGRCAEDDWTRTSFGHGSTQYSRGGTWDQQRLVASALLNPNERLVDIAPFHPDYAKPKAFHWDRLGHLAELTVSCRRPIEYAPCGKCHSCSERAAAAAGTSAVPEIADFIKLGGYR